MPGAAAEAGTAAMDNAVNVWRLNTASRLQRSPVYAGQSIILRWCFICRPYLHEDMGGPMDVPRAAAGG